MFTLRALTALCSLTLSASAASFPPKPEGVTVVESTKFPGVSISYKEVGRVLDPVIVRITYQRIDEHL
jgi:hypothetical protein